MNNSVSIAQIGFVVSVAVLSLLYGYSARQSGLFPDTLVRQVQSEASNIWYRPSLATRVYDNRVGVRIVDSSEVQPGLTFINSLWNDSGQWTPGFNLINREGNVLHRWRVDRSTLFPDSIDRRGDPTQKLLRGSHLLPNGDVVFNVDYVGTVRIDACSNVIWRLPQGNHHSVARADDGTFWISGTSKRRRRTTSQHPDGFPGLDDPVWLDQLHHVRSNGTLLKQITVLDLLYKNELERHLVQAYEPQDGGDAPRTADLTHLNDVEPLSASMANTYPLFDAGDLLVSLRKIDFVFVVDPDTETVKWHTSEHTIQQHDPDFIGNGWIGIFDNNRDFLSRGNMLGGSRIVAIQPHTPNRFTPTRRASGSNSKTEICCLLKPKRVGWWRYLPRGKRCGNGVSNPTTIQRYLEYRRRFVTT